jgi:hypothetical protein
MVLKIGNFLNQQDKLKGNKSNFKPELLTSLALTKGVGPHKGTSMMDFLLQMVVSKQPRVAEFAHKLRACEEASKIDLEILKNQLQEFQAKLPLFESEVASAETHYD